MHLVCHGLNLSILILKLIICFTQLVHKKLGLVNRLVGVARLAVRLLRTLIAVLSLFLEEICFLPQLLNQVIFLHYLVFKLLELLIVRFSLSVSRGCRCESRHFDQIVPLQQKLELAN